MIRFGIVSRDRIPVDMPRSRSRPTVALTLLADLNATFSAGDEKALALIYRSLRAGPVVKHTFPERYATIDAAIVAEIDRVFAPDRTLRVHEMGASNAITSLELFERLRHRRNLSFRATDYFDTLHVVRVPGSRWRVVFDAEHQPLQFVGKRMVLSAVKRDPGRYPVNRLVRRVLMATTVRRAARILNEAAGSDDGRVERIALFHPRCLAAARSDNRFSLGRDSIFEPASGSYEVIRLMGVVQRFSPDQIANAFRAIAQRLVDGGLLIAGHKRERDDPLRAPTTIFQRRGRGFVAVRDLAGSYAHRQLILSLDLGATAPAGA